MSTFIELIEKRIAEEALVECQEFLSDRTSNKKEERKEVLDSTPIPVEMLEAKKENIRKFAAKRLVCKPDYSR